MGLSSTETRHYEQVGIDPAHVKDVLGVGAQNLVRRLEVPGAPHPQVIKSPLIQVRPWHPYSLTVARILSQTYKDARQQFDDCKKHLQPYMVNTDFAKDPKSPRFSVVQDLLAMEELTPEISAAREDVRLQLADLFRRNGAMLKSTGSWLDAMGFKASKFAWFLASGRPYLENVVLLRGTLNVRVFDYGLFPEPSKAPTGLRWYFHGLLAAQRANARGYGFEFDPSSQV